LGKQLYLWESGDDNQSAEGDWSFTILPEDVDEFPELREKAYVLLLESDQGFVIEV